MYRGRYGMFCAKTHKHNKHQWQALCIGCFYGKSERSYYKGNQIICPTLFWLFQWNIYEWETHTKHLWIDLWHSPWVQYLPIRAKKFSELLIFQYFYCNGLMFKCSTLEHTVQNVWVIMCALVCLKLYPRNYLFLKWDCVWREYLKWDCVITWE